ncbi:hypothetical protein Tco_1325015 [Tanacetum coccineum]
MVEENPRDVANDTDVVYGDETLPHLYENSRISSDQIQQQSAEAFPQLQQQVRVKFSPYHEKNIIVSFNIFELQINLMSRDLYCSFELPQTSVPNPDEATSKEMQDEEPDLEDASKQGRNETGDDENLDMNAGFSDDVIDTGADLGILFFLFLG